MIYNFLCTFFIRCTVRRKNELACEASPYVYQLEWLGEDIVEPWEEVQRCIAKKGCKPNGINPYVKSISFPCGKNSINQKFESRVNYTN